MQFHSLLRNLKSKNIALSIIYKYISLPEKNENFIDILTCQIHRWCLQCDHYWSTKLLVLNNFDKTQLIFIKFFLYIFYSQPLIIYLLPSAVSYFTYLASLNPFDSFARRILLALFSLVPYLISSVGGRAGFPSFCFKALLLNSPLCSKGDMHGAKNDMKAPSSLELNGFHIKFNYSGLYH